MEGAYFVGRKEVLAWINTTCQLNIAKVEDTASGAVACLLLDMLYPGQVPLGRVNWSANKSFEYVSNYKILQNAFTKLKIDRHIDVDRLISGRAMDNLEFMQWFKRYFELEIGSRPPGYDPTASRLRGKGGSTYKGAIGVGMQLVQGEPRMLRPNSPQDLRQPHNRRSLLVDQYEEYPSRLLPLAPPHQLQI